MANDVKWIKIKVGMFDGNSFKRIKRAKIDGVVDFRDKLTAIWFELLDLGGKVNNNGFLLNDEIAFRNYEDIAIALDRTSKEIEMCMNWYVDNNMMEIIDNIFLISNWEKYQNNDGLEKIRLSNRERQKRFRENKKQLLLEHNNDNVSVTLHNATPLISKSISKSSSKSFVKPSLEEVMNYCNERNNNVDYNRWYDFYESKGWMIGKNKMKDWKAAVRTWEEKKTDNDDIIIPKGMTNL